VDEKEVLNKLVHDADKALRDDDVAKIRELLATEPLLKANINERLWSFDSPLVNHVKSAAALDAVLEAGADINARSTWWAGGFGLLDLAEPELSAYAISRGARLTIHAAARLGMIDKVKEFVAGDAASVHARGGDGKMPLHFASTVEIADYLLDHGADIEAKCIDHESTAMQYLIKSDPKVAARLIERGAKPEILAAAALGDVALAKKLLDADPECIRTRVSEEYFPMIGQGRSGGTIYQWVLGWYVSAPQVAWSFGHHETFDLLMARCPADEKLLNACLLHDEELVKSLLAENPRAAATLSPAARKHLAHAARDNDIHGVRLMLMAGLPLDGRSVDKGTPLHWAAFHGNPEMVRLLIQHGAALEDRGDNHQAPPIGWAMYGSQFGWRPGEGDYPGAVQALLDAGATIPERTAGSDAVKAVIERWKNRVT
jgi:ankyrin repeat protein